VTIWLVGSATVALVALCWLAARKATYHRGKSDAFQQVADDFAGLSRCTWWPKRKAAEQAAERKKRMLNLCLCDPAVCDALEDALHDARDFWNQYERGMAPAILELVSTWGDKE
jgi:hypothetical protein